jgi:hypothetical protein
MNKIVATNSNGCYSIEAVKYYGGEKYGTLVQFSINDGEHWICISLSKKEAFEFCENVICSIATLEND